jgi:hypothetical protein
MINQSDIELTINLIDNINEINDFNLINSTNLYNLTLKSYNLL